MTDTPGIFHGCSTRNVWPLTDLCYWNRPDFTRRREGATNSFPCLCQLISSVAKHVIKVIEQGMLFGNQEAIFIVSQIETIGLATKWLRVLSLADIDKIRNHLVANTIETKEEVWLDGGRCVARLANIIPCEFQAKRCRDAVQTNARRAANILPDGKYLNTTVHIVHVPAIDANYRTIRRVSRNHNQI